MVMPTTATAAAAPSSRCSLAVHHVCRSLSTAAAAVSPHQTNISTPSSSTWKPSEATDSSSSSNSVAFERIQHGVGRLVATASPVASNGSSSTTTTRLTTIRHQAPARCIPIQSSAVRAAGGALVALSNYGGGLLPGDNLRFDVHVQEAARLGLQTQGSNRVYKPSSIKARTDGGGGSQSALCAKVERDGLLVVAPDPVTPFAKSQYRQVQDIVLGHVDASVCVVDWFSAGRFLMMKSSPSSSTPAAGADVSPERWQQASLCNTTRLYLQQQQQDDDGFKDDPTLFLQDATRLDATPNSTLQNSRWGMDWGHTTGSSSSRSATPIQFNAYANILLYGPQVTVVVDRCRQLQYQLALQQTNQIRSRPLDQQGDNKEAATRLLETLSPGGRVVWGMNTCPLPAHLVPDDENDPNNTAAYMIRVAATSNEDLYRLFHYCLQPLSSQYGLEFYKDRIRAVHSSSSMASVSPLPRSSSSNNSLPAQQQQVTTTSTAPSHSSALPFSHPPTTASPASPSYWSAYMLADSALPVGSFAHSAGLEAASQLNLVVGGPVDVATYVQAATRSTLQLAAPLVRASHARALSVLLRSRDSQQAKEQACTNAEWWKELDDYAQALLVSNELACRASVEQGRSLLRVALQWLQQTSETTTDNDAKNNKVRLLQSLQQCITQQSRRGSSLSSQNTGHLATVFGVVTALLDLPPEQACQLLGYCVARDMVSAAVRLNLVGPMASVGMIAAAQTAAEQGLVQVQDGMNNKDQLSMTSNRSGSFIAPHNKDHDMVLMGAAGCAPVVDAIQPCHDILATRLFRT